MIEEKLDRVRLYPLVGLLWIIRPLPSGAAAVTVFACLYRDRSVGRFTDYVAAASIFLISSATFALNDYCDAGTDAINLPYRPIPSGTIAPRAALSYAACAFVAGNFMSLFLGAPPFFLCIFCTIGSLVYSPFIKNMLVVKNLFVAVEVGAIFLFVGLVEHNAERTAPLFAAALPFVFARELLLDLRDAPGDRCVGHRTIPVVFGDSKALFMVCSVLVLYCMLGAYLLATIRIDWIHKAFLLGCEAHVAAAILIACGRGRSSKAWLTVSIQLLLVAMLMSVGAIMGVLEQ
jgi:4-hydroxybenzoate polyprenyltransferase